MLAEQMPDFAIMALVVWRLWDAGGGGEENQRWLQMRQGLKSPDVVHICICPTENPASMSFRWLVGNQREQQKQQWQCSVWQHLSLSGFNASSSECRNSSTVCVVAPPQLESRQKRDTCRTLE